MTNVTNLKFVRSVNSRKKSQDGRVSAVAFKDCNVSDSTLFLGYLTIKAFSKLCIHLFHKLVYYTVMEKYQRLSK